MTIEYEYRYVNFNKKKITSLIKANGGVKKGMFLFKIYVFTHPTEKNMYIRVRDEGYKITMTTKVSNGEFDEENEIIIDNYQTGIAILLGLGCKKKYTYEKIREIWNLPNCEIVFDTNPGRVDIMEIECTKLSDLKKNIKLLELVDVSHDDFDDNDLYKNMFGIDLNKKQFDSTFSNINSVLKPLVTKNKTQFNQLIKFQKQMYKKII